MITYPMCQVDLPSGVLVVLAERLHVTTWRGVALTQSVEEKDGRKYSHILCCYLLICYLHVETLQMRY